MPVWTTHKEYDEIAPLWKKARDAVKGQQAVHRAGEAYLPMLKDQDDDEYRSYKLRAVWFGASAQVIGGLTGMLFRRPPRVELPEAVKKMAEDIDMAGTPIDMMAREVIEEALTVSRVGLLVDHPPSPDTDGVPLTVGQKEKAGLRPTIQLYKTESILDWDFRRVGQNWALCQVRLEECHSIKKDRWTRTTEKRWRVLELDENDEYRQQIFRKKDERDLRPGEPEEEQVGEDIYPLMNNKRMNFIPFYCIGPADVDICPDEPVLIDLFDLNFAHYRVTADYEHGCHFTGLPTPWIAGYTPEVNEDGAAPRRLYVGSSHAWVFPDPNTKAAYLEFHGTGLKALQDNLEHKELQMAIVGSRMLVADSKGRSNESATSVTVHRTGESSRLSSIALAVSTAFERALKVFCEWAGADQNAVYQINRDFLPVMMDANTIAALVNALTTGSISFDTFWELLQRGDAASLEITADQEKERIKNNPPPVPKAPPSKGTEASSQVAASQGTAPPNV